MILAEVHSDDYQYEVEFDATNWFEQATDEEIIQLISDNFGGDYTADGIALFNEEKNADIGCLMDYTRNKDEMGFEVHVSPSMAMSWIQTNRPTLVIFLTC